MKIDAAEVQATANQVIALIEAVARAAADISSATESERAMLHPDLVAKADEIVAMLELDDAA